MVKRVSTFFFAFVLAVGLLPLPAFADEPTAERVPQLEPGTYVEHEAIAYVLDDGARARTFSLGGDLIDGAQTLMEVDADAAEEALGDEVGAGETASAGRARMLSLDSASGETAGCLVLVRDESKTTEELIAALQADDRVVFAEPNGYVESFDAEPDEDMEDGVDADAGDAGSAMDPDEGGSLTEDSGSDVVVNGDVVPSEASDEAAIEGSSDDEGVAASDNVDGQIESAGDAIDAEPTVIGSDKDEPASDMTAFQWGMSNNGSMGGVSAEEAVDIEYSGWNDAAAAGDLEEVVVAVIDSGVDETNPDLAGVLWDEGEEYPELTVLGGDAHGFSTVPDTTSTSPISAEQSHGTHVAGIIAAEWNNEGTSGVAPNAKIMSVRSEVDAVSDMLRCINYVTEAAKAGVNVRVANCSWGMGSNASRAFDVAFTQMGKAGVMAVFASGNSDSDMDATLNTISALRDNPYVVVTDSIDASGELSMFSCYGQATTDVVAPGSTILSTWPTSDPQYLRLR